MSLSDKIQVLSDFLTPIQQAIGESNRNDGGLDFKQHVLGTLFYRFVSEYLSLYINEKEREGGNNKFNYSKLSDSKAEKLRTATLEEKGFFILPSELFENVHKKAARNRNLNDTLESIFNKIELSTQNNGEKSQFNGLFHFLLSKDNSQNKVDNKILRNLLDTVGKLPIGSNGNKPLEFFGDAFELLLYAYPSKFGYTKQSKFSTAKGVSELLVKIAASGKKKVEKVYDPTCSLGGLLLKFAKVLGRENIRSGFYGQEISEQSYNLCRLNMILHNFNCENFDIACGDTLSNPHHRNDQPFEAIVSNPPYSSDWEGESNPMLRDDERFTPAGVFAPEHKADWAFVMHSLAYLAENGTAAVVTFPGAMRRDGIEQKIRRYLVENNFVDTVIHLPYKLYSDDLTDYCILVMKRNKPDEKVLFIDASQEFDRNGSRKKLKQRHIEKILNCHLNREEIRKFSRLVDNSEIADNDYKIDVSTYLKEIQELADIEELNEEIGDLVLRQSKLRTTVDAVVADLQVGVV